MGAIKWFMMREMYGGSQGELLCFGLRSAQLWRAVDVLQITPACHIVEIR